MQILLKKQMQVVWFGDLLWHYDALLILIKGKFLGEKLGSLEGKLPSCPPNWMKPCMQIYM